MSTARLPCSWSPIDYSRRLAASARPLVFVLCCVSDLVPALAKEPCSPCRRPPRVPCPHQSTRNSTSRPSKPRRRFTQLHSRSRRNRPRVLPRSAFVSRRVLKHHFAVVVAAAPAQRRHPRPIDVCGRALLPPTPSSTPRPGCAIRTSRHCGSRQPPRFPSLPTSPDRYCDLIASLCRSGYSSSLHSRRVS